MHGEDGRDRVGEDLRANLRTLAEIRADTQHLREDAAMVRADVQAALQAIRDRLGPAAATD